MSKIHLIPLWGSFLILLGFVAMIAYLAYSFLATEVVVTGEAEVEILQNDPVPLESRPLLTPQSVDDLRDFSGKATMDKDRRLFLLRQSGNSDLSEGDSYYIEPSNRVYPDFIDLVAPIHPGETKRFSNAEE